MSKYSKESLLSLYSIASIGPARMRKLISVFEDPDAVLSAPMRRLKEVYGIDHKTAEKIKQGPNRVFVDEQLKLIQQHDVQLLSYWDEQYPELLKSIYDPPVFLFVKGNLEALNRNMFAIVGARRPTGYGRMISEKFSKELAENGFAIISGFARGVDSCAHKAALKSGGCTLAVLGNGIDYIYPAENRELHNEIIRDGLIISEYAMGTKPDAGNFPKRNRIISGLSKGVLITEAGSKSGSLLTALYALEQNREVFAVPGTIASDLSRGSNRLIKEGAKLVQTVADILEEVQCGNGVITKVSPKEVDVPQLPENELIVYQLITGEAKHIDQIALAAEFSSSETLTLLLMLELKGLIRQMAGKMFIRI